jgi:hypothetical protein
MNTRGIPRPAFEAPAALAWLAVGWALACTSPALAGPPGPPGGLSVVVENETSNPVPVTGSLNVDNQVEAVIVNGPSEAVPVTISESPDSHVVLQFRFDSGDVCSTFTGQGVGHLEFPDRSVDANPFTVPPGQALLITHVSWQAFTSGQGFPQGEYLQVSVGTRFGPLLVTGAVVTSDIAAAAYANGNENIDGGLLFRPGENVCISGGLRTGGVTTAGPSLNGTVLHGRLVDL